MRRVWVPVLGLMMGSGCATTDRVCSEQAPAGPGTTTCVLPDWEDRDYDLIVPEQGEAPYPVIVVLHGGGGSKNGSLRTTCPGGDVDDPACLDKVATAAGYALIVPDGTKANVGNLRTWNAGGGVDNYRCTSGKACEDNVDDVQYLKDLLDEVDRAVDIDESRVYFTGISNGGAMSYRFACAAADRVAAIAPMGGGNQAIVAPGCAPSVPVSALHTHGVEDPCWRYEGGAPDCSTGQDGLEHVSIDTTIYGDDEFAGWLELTGCTGEPVIEPIEDREDDGQSAERYTWSACDGGAEVQLIAIEGGGHAWPQGWAYLGERTIGKVPQDFSLNELMIAFFDAHSR